MCLTMCRVAILFRLVW